MSIKESDQFNIVLQKFDDLDNALKVLLSNLENNDSIGATLLRGKARTILIELEYIKKIFIN